MPPIRAASARLIPSSTAASDSRRRLWLACLDAAASRRSSSVEKSALTVTAVAMARILPRHGISSTSRGKSPASQNGRPLVLCLRRFESYFPHHPVSPRDGLCLTHGKWWLSQRLTQSLTLLGARPSHGDRPANTPGLALSNGFFRFRAEAQPRRFAHSGDE